MTQALYLLLLTLCGAAFIAALLIAARVLVRTLRRRADRRDQAIWCEHFNQRQRGGYRKSSDSYDYGKAVAGQARARRYTARGVPLRSVEQIAADEKERRRQSGASVVPIEVLRKREGA